MQERARRPYIRLWCSPASALTREVSLSVDDPTLIKLALEIGARSLMIPNVRTADPLAVIVTTSTLASTRLRMILAAANTEKA
jgi:2-keto-3-deoxy-L-rhamnonate aldolase RhmA